LKERVHAPTAASAEHQVQTASGLGSAGLPRFVRFGPEPGEYPTDEPGERPLVCGFERIAESLYAELDFCADLFGVLSAQRSGANADSAAVCHG